MYAQPANAANRAALTATLDAAVRAATADVEAYVQQGLHLLDVFHAGELPEEDEPRLAVALHIARIRDIAQVGISSTNAAERSAAWSNLAMRTEPVFVAPVATLAACATFLAGDRESGAAALEVAIACDPDYRVAHLMQGMLRIDSPLDAFDVSAVPLVYVRPRHDWIIPLVQRAELYREVTALRLPVHSGQGGGLSRADDRATVALAARDSGLAVQFANADAAHYEACGKTLTVTYDRDGHLVKAFYISTGSLPGRPLGSLADVIAALHEMTPRLAG